MLDTIVGWINSALKWVVSCLPDSPFQSLDMTPVQSVLPYINWIIPVDFILNVTNAWLAAVLVYYIYQAIMRWVKLL
jgi:hypothetical protein